MWFPSMSAHEYLPWSPRCLLADGQGPGVSQDNWPGQRSGYQGCAQDFQEIPFYNRNGMHHLLARRTSHTRICHSSLKTASPTWMLIGPGDVDSKLRPKPTPTPIRVNGVKQHSLYHSSPKYSSLQ
ncbi:hypothetical protein CPAR01_16269 [Colletotrichum paranaense]|uniref:Uncharacterized protein n=1 Tax=Colletotrichum paranaense TaxID=1914294 RepID=A0ABQ9RWA6_9PEZI|nr:uncharacterized protein CPAR01_16269 [Colletotrichum paranaense]KAK1516653.1 hypothetical protein CPAR01_16269 [Colletotrichum paranaense]